MTFFTFRYEEEMKSAADFVEPAKLYTAKPHGSLFWFSFDVCTVEIVCDFVFLECGFDLAFNMGLEMR